MFFFDSKRKEVEIREITIRDEWGVLQKLAIRRDASFLTDQELADALGVGLITVSTHRRIDQ